MGKKTAELSLATLWQLSPDLAADFKQQLEAAVADCRQRPSLSKKREVVLKLVVTPHPDDVDDVNIQPITSRKTPARAIDIIRARRTPRNQLQFDFEGDE